MKVAFYLENSNIKQVDLRSPEKGNPGVGGTEFNFITLAIELRRRYRFLDIKVFAQSTRLLPVELHSELAGDCMEAVKKAVNQGFEFFVWRPTVREDATKLVYSIEQFSIKFLIWAHNTPSLDIVKALAAAKNVRRFISVGEWQNRAIPSDEIKTKLTRIHNGFDHQAYKENTIKDPNLVVYTGSLIPVKGFGLLAKAWPMVIDKCPSAKLVVIGSGQLYNRNAELGPWRIANDDFEKQQIIPNLSDENGKLIPSVTFKGVMGVDKIPILKQAICGVVNPSGKGENCPGSAIEFLAAGTAVVSAANEGILDVVDDGITGLLGHDVQELADNIICMLKNTDYAKQLGANGPAVVKQRFDYENISDNWLQVFAEEQSFHSYNDHYFLPLSKQELSSDVAIRRAVSALPQEQQFILYANMTKLSQSRLPLDVRKLNDCWQITAGDLIFHFPIGIPSVKLLMCSFGYEQWLYSKYTLPGFVEPNGSDIVLDCGSFVGGFAYAVALLGCKVICVEPDEQNCQFIKVNLARFEDIHVECAGLHDHIGEMQINCVDNPVEHSLLTPDTGNFLEARSIPVLTTDFLIEKYDLKQVDYAKIEAEGVESEIIKGMDKILIPKLAIDCSPERNGKSPMRDIKAILQQKGYQTISRGWMLFARKYG